MNWYPASLILLPSFVTKSRLCTAPSVAVVLGLTNRRTRMAFHPCSLKNVSGVMVLPEASLYTAPAVSNSGRREISPPTYFIPEGALRVMLLISAVLKVVP